MLVKEIECSCRYVINNREAAQMDFFTMVECVKMNEMPHFSGSVHHSSDCPYGVEFSLCLSFLTTRVCLQLSHFIAVIRLAVSLAEALVLLLLLLAQNKIYDLSYDGALLHYFDKQCFFL